MSLPAFKTHIGSIHPSVFWSHGLVFPALVPVPAPFPQSSRHRSVPCLYQLCVLWQNRGKWLWRWRGPWAPWLSANKKLLSYRASCDKADWCRQGERDRVWWNHHPHLAAETGSPPTLRFKVGTELVITRHCLVNSEASALIKMKTPCNENRIVFHTQTLQWHIDLFTAWCWNLPYEQKHHPLCTTDVSWMDGWELVQKYHTNM